MLGIVVAGGLGTRLYPHTLSNNKHLLPVYDKPMIWYPIQTLIQAGIKDIAIVVSGPFAGNFISIIKNGSDLGLNSVSYFYQEKPDGGIADAIQVTKPWFTNQKVAVILGDNTTDVSFKEDVKSFNEGAKIFLKEVQNPKDFGCPEFENQKISSIIEKPVDPPSNYAVTGFYLFDEMLSYFLKKIKPSARNQLEITDILNLYIKNENLSYSIINGFWQDAGTFENLFTANEYWRKKSLNI